VGGKRPDEGHIAHWRRGEKKVPWRGESSQLLLFIWKAMRGQTDNPAIASIMKMGRGGVGKGGGNNSKGGDKFQHTIVLPRGQGTTRPSAFTA